MDLQIQQRRNHGESMTLSKKYYDKFAEIFSRHRGLAGFWQEFTKFLEEDNPKFDGEKWEEASAFKKVKE